MPVPVRKAGASDAAAVAGLLDRFNLEFETPTPGPAVLAGRVEQMLPGEGLFALLAGEPAVGIAIVSLRRNVWFDGPVALLDELYVIPDQRNRGIGTALLRAVEDESRARGACWSRSTSTARTPTRAVSTSGTAMPTATPARASRSSTTTASSSEHRAQVERETRVSMELADISRARRSREFVVLEGFHAIKHATRFGGEIVGAWTANPEELEKLRQRLAPDLEIRAEVVDHEALKAVVPRAQVVAVARRPVQTDADTVLAGPGHVVLLEDPRHLGNLGAAVRVAAAAGAAGVMTTGRQDPWHPDALRGSAGLHFALPVHHLRAVRIGDRELVALDPEGEPLARGELPAAAVLAFGTERDGISDELLAQATRRIALPMSPGVSSLNLATAVAATLYSLKLASA